MPNDNTLVAILFLACCVVSCLVGWKVSAWRKDREIANLNLAHANAKIVSDRKVQIAGIEAARTIEAAQAQADEEKKNASAEIKRLTDAVRAGDIRLSIATSRRDFLAVTAPTVVVAEERADIDEGAAAALIGLTQRGDEAIIELNSCIDSYSAAQRKLEELNTH